MQDEAGALFIVTGAHYTAAAIEAAHSVAKTNTWLKIGIFSDQPVTDPRADGSPDPVARPSPHRRRQPAHR